MGATVIGGVGPMDCIVRGHGHSHSQYSSLRGWRPLLFF